MITGFILTLALQCAAQPGDAFGAPQLQPDAPGPECAAPGLPAIDHIAATQQELVVNLQNPGRQHISLVELRPYQTYDPQETFPILWEGRAKAQPIRLDRFDGPRDRMFSKYQLVITKTGAPLGPSHYPTNLSALGARDFPFLWPKSIKGLQVQMVDDAIALGVKHGAINLYIPHIIDRSGTSPETLEIDGRIFHINSDYIRGLDATVKGLTDAGINVTAILNNPIPTSPDPANPFIHPRTDLAGAPNHLGAFNVTDDEGLLHYRAAMEYLAEHYSRPDKQFGWISGYIVGNEIQAHWEWYNIGKMALAEFIEHYGIALRYCDLAVRKHQARIRTYLSMEHHWTTAMREDPLVGFPGRPFLEQLSTWSKATGDFPWQVAFHPYPEDLFEPRFWNDQQALLSFDSPKITFKNCEVLPAFLNQPAFLFNGRPRRIIFSEQGFHTPDGPDGELIQAAAYACAYYRISHIPAIDAFILHRHVDHKAECGLKLGLWTWKEDGGSCTPGRKKAIYEVFRLADTGQWEEAFEFAKPIIGIDSWDEALPAATIPPSGSTTTPAPAPE